MRSSRCGRKGDGHVRGEKSGAWHTHGGVRCARRYLQHPHVHVRCGAERSAGGDRYRLLRGRARRHAARRPDAGELPLPSSARLLVQHRNALAMGKLKKILMVEDNEDCRFILVHRLRKIGQFDIREAAGGQDAIDAVRAELPDLIFMDLNMPAIDGLEATRRIREMEGGDGIRIIALTGRAMAGDEQKALASGCDDYLTKPIMDPDLVRQTLQRWLY